MTARGPSYLIKRLLLHAFLLGLGLLFIMPFFWSIGTSLKPLRELFSVTPAFLPEMVRWENYVDVFDQVPFGTFYLNTVFVTIARVIGQVFIASLAGFAFARLRFPGRDLLFILLLVGLMVPEQAVIVPRFILMREFGWINTYQGLIIPLIFSSFGVFLLRQFFLTIPPDFQEAATLEGANPFQVYWQIYLPLARPALAAFGFLVTLYSWNEFLWALIVTSTQERQVLSVGLAVLQGYQTTNTAILLAAANMATIPILVIFLFFQKQL
ncbi:MAG: carbohydrate ABC transporter permease, partial [Chloroflexota bacterium]|nr:carbohydrate ABC transporter permease [Chloroflexota bacterium]